MPLRHLKSFLAATTVAGVLALDPGAAMAHTLADTLVTAYRTSPLL